MANEMFTQLPTVGNASLSDIICSVQGYVNTANPGTSVQETLQQVFNLFNANMVLSYAGNPNGNLAGVTYQFCWDTTDAGLWTCTTTGNAASAVWTRTINPANTSLISVQTFTSGTAATYTKNTNAVNILVEVVGGGGGGGGSLGGATSLSLAAGGGGGGYARLFIAGAANTYTYTVGAGGAGGTSGNNAGTTGGTTTFSASSLQATGGAGGSGMGANSATTIITSQGGIGGVGTNGNINAYGTPGGNSFAVYGSTAGGGFCGMGGVLISEEVL